MRNPRCSLALSLAALALAPSTAHGDESPLRVQLRVPAERAAAIAAAVSAEVKRPVAAVDAVATCDAPCVVVAIGDEADTADVRYAGPAGEVRARAVALPADPSAAAETVALLADNLIHDEAADLLAAMRAAQEAAPVAPVASAAVASTAGLVAMMPEAAPPTAVAVAAPVPVGAAPPSATVAAPAPVLSEVRPRRFFSFGVIPLLSTDLIEVGQIRHDVSVDLLVGVSGGSNTFTASGLLDVENGPVGGGQLAGIGAVATVVEGVQAAGIGTMAGRNNGGQVGGVFTLTGGSVDGVQAAGVVNLAGGGVDGLQIAGVGNATGGGVDGFQLAGVANIAAGKADGFQVGGVANLTGGSVDGFQLAGVGNFAGGSVDGLQASGVAGIAAGSVDGLQLAGVANVVGSDVDGAQLAGVANVAGGKVDGFQLAGVANVAGDLDGFQLALVNIAGRLDGAQVGLINVATAGEGASVGLITIVPGGRTDLELSFDSGQLGTLLFRHGSRRWHNVYGLGGRAGNENGDGSRDEDIWMYGLGMGPTWDAGRVRFDLDAMGWHVNRGAAHESDLSILAQLRFTVGYDLGLATLVGGVVGNVYISTTDSAGDLSLGTKTNLARCACSGSGDPEETKRAFVWPSVFVGMRL